MVFEKPQKKTVTKPMFLMKPSSDIHGMSQTFRPCEPPMKESCFFNTLPESRWGTKIATHTHLPNIKQDTQGECYGNPKRNFRAKNIYSTRKEYTLYTVYIYIYIIEGSLEVKLPTNGQMKRRDGKIQREEKSRREKIREEKESEERRCRCAKR